MKMEGTELGKTNQNIFQWTKEYKEKIQVKIGEITLILTVPTRRAEGGRTTGPRAVPGILPDHPSTGPRLTASQQHGHRQHQHHGRQRQPATFQPGHLLRYCQ